MLRLFPGSNSPEWAFSLLGAVFAGGLATGVYTTNTAEAVLYQLKHRSELPLPAQTQVWTSSTSSNKVLNFLYQLKHRSELPLPTQTKVWTSSASSNTGLNFLFQLKHRSELPLTAQTLVWTSSTSSNTGLNFLYLLKQRSELPLPAQTNNDLLLIRISTCNVVYQLKHWSTLRVSKPVI